MADSSLVVPSYLASIRRQDKVVRDIAGGPELIESMDGSAGNYLEFDAVKRVGTLNKHGW